MTDLQQKAYNKYILARDKAKKVRQSEISHCIDVAGLNHPLYVVSDTYVAYVEAFKEWLAVEPEYRKTERMSATRGDYGTADNWDEKPTKIKEL